MLANDGQALDRPRPRYAAQAPRSPSRRAARASRPLTPREALGDTGGAGVGDSRVLPRGAHGARARRPRGRRRGRGRAPRCRRRTPPPTPPARRARSHQLTADLLVDGRPPQRVPTTVGRLEVRVHEPGGERPAERRRGRRRRSGPCPRARGPVVSPRGDRGARRARRVAPRRRAPRGAMSATAGIPMCRPPAESSPSADRTRTNALASSCHRSSRPPAG